MEYYPSMSPVRVQLRNSVPAKLSQSSLSLAAKQAKALRSLSMTNTANTNANHTTINESVNHPSPA
ncbi:unnamed protein product [Sphenostylis stenocarpa]|uniref:Uncharacterized protein n=1 Tax=Sphenostylis stenocarpa TaxID=92480 RepID=A0AA86SWG1_9FABA|nr:unnamed protein product [Sphenostylis stenocarpa]